MAPAGAFLSLPFGLAMFELIPGTRGWRSRGLRAAMPDGRPIGKGPILASVRSQRFSLSPSWDQCGRMAVPRYQARLRRVLNPRGSRQPLPREGSNLTAYA